jgi:hypothetical protein
MNVNLAEELFTSHAVDEATIIQLICMAFEGRHRVFPRIHPEALDKWLSRHSSNVVDKCKFCIEESLTAASLDNCDQDVQVRPRTDDWSNLKLSPDSALTFLQSPIEVWFENDLNDSSFLLSCVTDETSKKLREFEERRWVQFQNAGGIGSMSSRISRMAENRRRSTIFIFDSDSRLPGVRSRQAHAVITACNERHIQYHCLSRRSIENYIPTKTLKKWAYHPGVQGRDSRVRKQRVRAFESITEEQRFFYNLKLGFDGDVAGNTNGEWISRKDEIDRLFVGISDENRNHLRSGIQKDIATQIYGKIAIPYTQLWEYGTSNELNEIAQNILRKA